MRSLTIDLPDDTAAYFDTLSSEAQKMMKQQANVLVAAYINQSKADAEGFNGLDAEDAAWWRSLTPDEQAEERAVILRSMAEGDAGRTKPAEEVYARLRAKFADKAAL